MDKTARFHTLGQWLQWQETLHPSPIDLGLERVARVAARLQCASPAPVVISVAGTNGKGSSVALLEAILSRAGYRVGCYTSPHLLRYNERVRLQGKEAADAVFCEAFARIDAARGSETLTYFEFGTLAALDIMARATLDVAVLEVGLGGRLDAVNVVDADVALITSIGIDHSDWLGTDRESIAREKAGIMRAARPAVCGDADPPASLRAAAHELGAALRVRGSEFGFTTQGQVWHWQGEHGSHRDLPGPALQGPHQLANAASVLMVLELLRERLPVSREAIADGLQGVRLAGRVQRLPGTVEQVLDVAHNAQAAQALADALRQLPPAPRTHAVIGMMQDKDTESFVAALAPLVSRWYPVGLAVERAMAGTQLAARIAAVAGAQCSAVCATLADAVALLRAEVKPGERVLVCGSFHTVAGWAALKPEFE